MFDVGSQMMEDWISMKCSVGTIGLQKKEYLEMRSVGTLYVQKIFAYIIKFRRNERFVEIMTTQKMRSVGTLYVQKIFPNKIKFRRNDRFVEIMTTQKMRSVGTLYVQKIFPDIIQFRRNERFVEIMTTQKMRSVGTLCLQIQHHKEKAFLKVTKITKSYI